MMRRSPAKAGARCATSAPPRRWTPAMPNVDPRTGYLLRLGDDALVLGQRLGEWCGHGPVLEVDISLANLALDLIGQATLFLGEAGDGDHWPSIATCSISELPAGRAAQRRLRANHRAPAALFDLAAHALTAADAVERPVPREFAAKAVKEIAYHRELASGMDDPARRRHRGELAAHGRGARLVLALRPRIVRGR